MLKRLNGEIFLFYIPDINPPGITYLLLGYSIFFISWIGMLIFRKYCCHKQDNQDLNYSLELYRILE